MRARPGEQQVDAPEVGVPARGLLRKEMASSRLGSAVSRHKPIAQPQQVQDDGL